MARPTIPLVLVLVTNDIYWQDHLSERNIGDGWLHGDDAGGGCGCGYYNGAYDYGRPADGSGRGKGWPITDVPNFRFFPP